MRGGTISRISRRSNEMRTLHELADATDRRRFDELQREASYRGEREVAVRVAPRVVDGGAQWATPFEPTKREIGAGEQRRCQEERHA